MIAENKQSRTIYVFSLRDTCGLFLEIEGGDKLIYASFPNLLSSQQLLSGVEKISPNL